jgi:hypothetical protein
MYNSSLIKFVMYLSLYVDKSRNLNFASYVPIVKLFRLVWKKIYFNLTLLENVKKLGNKCCTAAAQVAF